MTEPSSPQFGGVLMALGSAFLWAISTTLWKPAIVRYGARAINFFKCAVATVYLWLTVLLLVGPDAFTTLLTRPALMLMLSGVIGLAVGDALFFHSLRKLGAQPSTVLMQTSPIWSALLGVALFTERLTTWQYLAIPVVFCGAVLVIQGRVRSTEVAEHDARDRRVGVIAGVAAAILNAVGFLIAKDATDAIGDQVAELAPDGGWVPAAMTATALRMTAAAGFLLLYAMSRRQLAHWIAPMREWRRRGVEMVAVFLGTYLGVFLAQASLQHVAASVTVCVCSTTPVFLLPLAVWRLGERYRWIAFVGTLLAVVGVVLLAGQDALVLFQD